MTSTITLYPLSNYTFSTKEAQPEEDPSVTSRLQRLQIIMKISVCEGRPGDYLRPGEDDVEGLKERLDDRLAPPSGQFGAGLTSAQGQKDWEIGDYESFMYPYVPAHITKPKECKMLYLVQLPEKKVLSVPKNMKLLAIPLFELYDNPQRYGPQLAAIPHVLSRFSFIYA
ncbi:hypothetical protein H4Q26_010625 [Puccinia striiformis f. sp. tritici PST-130]|nr:hypothetical protein H4Q26_010625 [Puccinia striiformis f. sp. tritici PST-130]